MKYLSLVLIFGNQRSENKVGADLQLPRWCRLLSGDIEPRQGIITRAPACPWGRGALLLHHPPPLQYHELAYLSIQHVLHTLPPSILCQAVLLQHVQLYFHT